MVETVTGVVGILVAAGSLVFAALAWLSARESARLSRDQLALARRSEQQSELEVVVGPVEKEVSPARNKVVSGPNCYEIIISVDTRLQNRSTRGNAVVKAELLYERGDEECLADLTSLSERNLYERGFPSNTEPPVNIGSGSTTNISFTFILKPPGTLWQWIENPPTDVRMRLTDNYNRVLDLPLPRVTRLVREFRHQQEELVYSGSHCS